MAQSTPGLATRALCATTPLAPAHFYPFPLPSAAHCSLGRDRFAGVDIRLRVTGGGHSSQVYAIRQALAKALVAYYHKCACQIAAVPQARGCGREGVAAVCGWRAS